MARLPIRDARAGARKTFLATLLTHLPSAWVSPSEEELVSLYQRYYRLAMDEKKYDIALVFLNKILEIQPKNFEARFRKCEIYHVHTGNVTLAIDQYKKLIRMAPPGDQHRELARSSLSELIEMVS
ncbi:MAG: hypothetical protein R3338_00530 [Thermoanaerobaculia bacterium]|nr:hypothetical protein [Thermoanaerobaculia bacterium]